MTNNEAEARAFPERLQRIVHAAVAFEADPVRLFAEDESRLGLYENTRRRRASCRRRYASRFPLPSSLLSLRADLLQPDDIDEDLAGLGAVGGAEDAGVVELVDD